MKALTIDVYWAWLIAFHDKRVENRSWRTNYHGPLAIHAGKSSARDRDAIAWISENCELDLPSASEIDELRGCVVAICELVGCVSLEEYLEHGKDKYAFGPWCWAIESVSPLKRPVQAIGKQGIWNLVEEGEGCNSGTDV